MVNCTARQCRLIRPVLVKCSIITPTFTGLRKHLVIGQLNEYQFFSALHWSTSDTPPAVYTVYNRTVTNIENTVRAMHSCNSWFNDSWCIKLEKKTKIFYFIFFFINNAKLRRIKLCIINVHFLTSTLKRFFEITIQLLCEHRKDNFNSDSTKNPIRNYGSVFQA